MAKAIHWADQTAERIIRQQGEKDQYNLASGITPSGTVHFGNFRETITVDLVARALREKGKNVRFYFSWDDYDTFRKIPKNMPKQDELEKYLFQPIVDVPDPYGVEESYARHQEVKFEKQLDRVGVQVECLYQAKKYRGGEYSSLIKTILNKKETIRGILNKHRTTPLGEDYMPVGIYCEKCNRDNDIQNIKFDGDNTLSYECGLCGHKGDEGIEGSQRVKLPWRLDWPMRWSYEKTDFEPGGKDHSSEGGSYTTAKEIVKEVFEQNPPIYLQYDFVSIKGAGGKMSSSSGEVITVNDVLDIYEPEMVRWIFASYKTNVDFAISFDLDVIKTYEDFDRQERYAFGQEDGSEKKIAQARRAYELSQIKEMPSEMPFQPAFRHLCNILQINDGDIAKAREYYVSEIKNDRDERRYQERAKCAWFWINNYAPEDFKFAINKFPISLDMNELQTKFVTDFKSYLESSWDEIESDKFLHEKMYEIIHEHEVQPADVFPVLYKKLISKEKGPKLAGFIRTIGKERVLSLL